MIFISCRDQLLTLQQDNKFKGVKIMKKRVLAVMLICAAAMFAGCSSSDSQPEESAGKVSITESSVKPDESSVSESSAEQASTEQSSKAESSKDESSKASSKAENSKKESSAAQTSKQSTVSQTTQVVVQQPQTQTETPSEQQTQPSQNEPQPSQQEPAQEPSQQQPASSGSSEAAILVNGQIVRIMTEMNSVSSVFGTPTSVESVQSCLGSNKDDDKIYYYNGYLVQTLNDGVEKIYYISITDTGVSTAKGIKIGDSTTDVKNAYGTPSLEEDWMYMYSFDNDKYSLEFMLIDGTVSEINVVAEVM